MSPTLIPGKPVLGLGSFDLSTQHYVVQEYLLSGDAVSYRAVGVPTDDGKWNVEVDQHAPFATRLVVVRPEDSAKFNGTVIVEWLNVSAGTDGAPDWSYTHRELIRQGYAYVGVSAQKGGIDGGGMSLGIPGVLPIKKADPQRYADLNHPGDAFAYDIYTQAARAIRHSRDSHLLGPLTSKHVIATGESQSAGYLTTYVDAIEPVSKAFDGFLIHSRFGSGAPITGAYVASAAATAVKGLHIRTDTKKPVLIFISESDLMFPGGYLTARQPDNDRLRTWEVAGTAHADTYTLGGAAVDSGSAPIEVLAKAYAPSSSIMGMPLAQPMNSAPQHHYVMQAALAALNRWVVSGQAPPHGQQLNTTEATPPQLAVDENRNATGGVRSPWMDVPTAHLSGLGQTGAGMVVLFGVTEPFDAAKLSRLYPGGQAEYVGKFNTSLKSAIAAGFILPADETEIQAMAAHSFSAGP
ncbi:MAG TPA: alpha/beta hydrolase domain-containing protein [Steroidobacteraceae bacterium]|nr:alpha/beta hydrolase domain-containing protein [Steroidobacteraceae bacterium]